MKLVKKKIKNNTNLFYIFQERFSVHDFGAIHRSPYSLTSITPLAMMRRMIKNVNAKYPTNEAMQSFRQQLYGLAWIANTSLENNAFITTFSATAVRGDLLKIDWVDVSMIHHVLDSLYLPSFHSPNFIEKDSVFDEEKTFNLYRLQQIQANIGEKIFTELKTMFPKDNPYISDLRGDHDGISAFNKNHLKPFYDFWIQYPLDFYYVGPLPIDIVVRHIEQYPHLRPSKHEISLVPTPLLHEAPIEKTVQGTQSQSHLVQIYTTGIVRLTKDSYAIRLLNQILGIGSESILFQELREKRQFCYAVSSSYSLNEATITIRVGLHKKNISQAKEVIAEHLKFIQNGQLNQELFEIAKQQMIDGIIRYKDTVDHQLSILVNTMVLDIPYDEDRALNFYRALTIEDMQRVANMIQSHRELIYLGKES